MIQCFEEWHELSQQKQWELFKAACDVVEIACRRTDHERNTASSMPKEHCEAQIEGRMKLRAMMHKACDAYRDAEAIA